MLFSCFRFCVQRHIFHLSSQLFISQMNIETKFPDYNRSYGFIRIGSLAMFFIFLSGISVCLEVRYRHSRALLIRSSGDNVTVPEGTLCHIPFDDCRCSVITNRTNPRMECISDAVAMIGHILPLVFYALQIYTISLLFSFTGHGSNFRTDIFWIVALLVFIIIAVAAHGSTCLQTTANAIVNAAGLAFIMFIAHLSKRAHDLTAARESNNTDREKRVLTAKVNQKREIMIKTNVSEL